MKLLSKCFHRKTKNAKKYLGHNDLIWEKFVPKQCDLESSPDDDGFRLKNWFHHQSSGKCGKKRWKYVNFLKNAIFRILGRLPKQKSLILLVKEEFLFDISVSDTKTQLQRQKTIKKTLNGPKNVILYMCRMTHHLDMEHPSFCLWNVIFTEDSM